MRLVDLSVTIRERLDVQNPRMRVTIDRTDHATAAIERAAEIGIAPSQLPIPGIHFAAERVSAQMHGSGTHVDAPWHYGPECAGVPARRIDELPLEWFHGPGVVLDMSARQDGGVLVPEDIVAALGEHVLRPGEIVLIRTDLDKFTGPDRHLRLRELGREATLYLLDRGVRVIGVDAASPDRSNAAELRAGRRERYFPAHHVGREREFCIVELLTNLHLLPHDGFTVSLFPIKLGGGSGGWCRAVAFLQD